MAAALAGLGWVCTWNNLIHKPNHMWDEAEGARQGVWMGTHSLPFPGTAWQVKIPAVSPALGTRLPFHHQHSDSSYITTQATEQVHNQNRRRMSSGLTHHLSPLPMLLCHPLSLVFVRFWSSSVEVSEDWSLFQPLGQSRQDKELCSEAAGRKQGGIPNVLLEVGEHGPHQCFTTAASFLLTFSKASSRIGDLQLLGALTKPRFLLNCREQQSRAGISSQDRLMSVPFLHLRACRSAFRNTERCQRVPVQSCMSPSSAKVCIFPSNAYKLKPNATLAAQTKQTERAAGITWISVSYQTFKLSQKPKASGSSF